VVRFQGQYSVLRVQCQGGLERRAGTLHAPPSRRTLTPHGAQAFQTIAKNALQQEANQKPIFIPQTIDLKGQAEQPQSGGCCS
jgi:hypothetical protein